MSRSPWLERVLGGDRLTVWHRWAGFACLWLLVGHAVLTTVGFGMSDGSGVVTEIGTLLFTYPWVLMATVGLVLLIAVAVTSIRAARRRLSYETWYGIHLYAYLGIALAFLHELVVGTDFVNDPVAVGYWVGPVRGRHRAAADLPGVPAHRVLGAPPAARRARRPGGARRRVHPPHRHATWRSCPSAPASTSSSASCPAAAGGATIRSPSRRHPTAPRCGSRSRTWATTADRLATLAARHPRLRRGTIWRLHPRADAGQQGAVHRGRHRHHAPAGDDRGAPAGRAT